MEASSGGSKPGPIKKEAIEVVQELGIDVSHDRSKHLREFEGQWFDYAVTLCGDQEEFNPFFPDAREHLHHGVDDPPGIDGA